MTLPRRPPAPPKPSTGGFIGRWIERILFAGVSYFILLIVSFSFFTGRFPPRKEDLNRSAVLVKKMLFDANESNQQIKTLKEMAANGQQPNLEQLAEFQRLSLRRTEVAMELLSIFKKLNLNNPANPELAEKLNAISENLTIAEKGLGEITTHLQATTSGQ